MSMWVTRTPNSPMPWCRKAKVQPYSVLSTTISSPGRSSVHKVAVIAPIPEPNEIAPAPPSSSAMRDSSSASVGLAMRV